MKLKKLKLEDFMSVEPSDLLVVKGGYGGYYDCQDVPKQGDPDGFGGYFDQDAVIVYASSEENPYCNWVPPGKMNSSWGWQRTWSYWAHVLTSEDCPEHGD